MKDVFQFIAKFGVIQKVEVIIRLNIVTARTFESQPPDYRITSGVILRFFLGYFNVESCGIANSLLTVT